MKNRPFGRFLMCQGSKQIVLLASGLEQRNYVFVATKTSELVPNPRSMTDATRGAGETPALGTKKENLRYYLRFSLSRQGNKQIVLLVFKVGDYVIIKIFQLNFN